MSEIKARELQVDRHSILRMLPSTYRFVPIKRTLTTFVDKTAVTNITMGGRQSTKITKKQRHQVVETRVPTKTSEPKAKPSETGRRKKAPPKRIVPAAIGTSPSGPSAANGNAKPRRHGGQSSSARPTSAPPKSTKKMKVPPSSKPGPLHPATLAFVMDTIAQHPAPPAMARPNTRSMAKAKMEAERKEKRACQRVPRNPPNRL